jgi:hypothetical protein
MRISIIPRPIVTVRPEIKAHRPPVEYIDLLNKSEVEFRKYISEIESNSSFEKLIKEGCIKKVHYRGRIPSHLYQEYQDKQFMEFLQEYNITSKTGWESDFFDKNARRKIKELSAKYKAPKGELLKSLEYCRHLQLAWNGHEEESYTSFTSLDDPEKFHSPEAPQISNQSDEYIEILTKLLEENSISENDFMEYFLSGSRDPYDIARELDIDLDTTQEILDTLEEVQMLSSMQVNVVDDQDVKIEPKAQIIAVIRRMNNPPRAEIQIDASKQYGSRYEITNPEVTLSKDESSLIEKLRMINQRRALTFRVVGFIYDFQYPYFVSGNELYLKPLSQSQISKEMGEHESTISRILRNKSVETPEGIFTLRFFCQSKKEVIGRLIMIREKAENSQGLRSKPFSDAEIANILEKEYSTKISRRTVTYYRNKMKEVPKFYTRKRKPENQKTRKPESLEV